MGGRRSRPRSRRFGRTTDRSDGGFGSFDLLETYGGRLEEILDEMLIASEDRAQARSVAIDALYDAGLRYSPTLGQSFSDFLTDQVYERFGRFWQPAAGFLATR